MIRKTSLYHILQVLIKPSSTDTLAYQPSLGQKGGPPVPDARQYILQLFSHSCNSSTFTGEPQLTACPKNMENFSLASVNATRAPIMVNVSNQWNPVSFAPYILFGIFLYYILQMLNVFFTTASLRENSRYIFFAFLMVNDTVYLFTCVLMYSFALETYAIPTLACNIVVAIASTTFSNTPSGLAAMALERYVAICLPLRHAEICRAERSYVFIGMMCVFGLLPYLVDFTLLGSSVSQNFFFHRKMCSREALFATTLQAVLRFVTHGSLFTMVAFVILYTYIRIVLEARKISGDRAGPSKAKTTVILHAIQLLLCLTSFTHPITEMHFPNYFFKYFNMIAFMFLPRFLSPLIYGFRDEAFRNHVKICLPCCPRRPHLDVCRV